MSVFHLFPHSTFMASFIKGNNLLFGTEEHFFIIYGSSAADDREVSNESNVLIVQHFRDIDKATIKAIKNSQKIIVHSFFSLQQMAFLLFHRLYKKSYLLFWGAEIYQFRETKSFLREVRKRIMKWGMRRAFAFITLIPGDYDIVSRFISSEKRYFSTRYYSDYLNFHPREKHSNVPVRILLGNSATATNRHCGALDALSRFALFDIEVIAPLSYGDKAYAERIVAYGSKLFGDKFLPLLEYMDLEDYNKIIESIDIGIFNNDRQQALGNINVLLQTGAKVFLSRDTSMWKYYTETCGCSVYCLDELQDMEYETFVDFKEETGRQNNEAIHQDIRIRPELWREVYEDNPSKK